MRQRVTALVIGWLAVSAAAASAETCNVIEDYRAADAAYARKDFAAAATGFRALAEQGLGPAQLRLGQMLAAGEGAPADKAEAVRWTVLAVDVNTPGAKDALAKLGAASAKPDGWKPKLGPCLSVDPRTKRPDGSAGYNVEQVVNHVLKGRELTNPQAVNGRAWLVRSLESVRTKSPRHLIYLKSLYGVALVARGPLVVVDTKENLPLVVVNAEIATDSSTDGGRELTGAAVYAIHKQLLPAVVTFETQSYKGRTIRIPVTDEGRQFLGVMKQAIDMADGLPPDLAKQARAVLDLRYEPREPYDKRGGAQAPGDIRRDPASGQNYLSYAEIFASRGPAHIVVNLTSAGIRQRRFNEYQEANRQLEEARKRNATAEAEKAEKRMAEIKAMETGADKRGFCELLENGIKTMEALKMDPREINQEYKVRTSRGCA